MTSEPGPCQEPRNEEAERAVLGAVLLGNGSVLDPLVGVLAPGHFYWSQHRAIWRAMTELHAAGRDVDRLVLTQHLRETGRLEAAGGRETIDVLATCTPNWSHFKDYGRIVHRTAQFRRRARAAAEMRDAALREDEAAYVAAWERGR